MSKSQAFLSTLSADDAEKWLDEIIEQWDYIDFVNEDHIKPNIISWDELKLSASIIGFDGKDLAEWMKCIVRRSDVRNPPADPHRVRVSRNTSQYPSIEEKVLSFFRSNSLRSMKIRTYHIALRSIKEFLPALSNDSGSSE